MASLCTSAMEGMSFRPQSLITESSDSEMECLSQVVHCKCLDVMHKVRGNLSGSAQLRPQSVTTTPLSRCLSYVILAGNEQVHGILAFWQKTLNLKSLLGISHQL